MATDLKVVLEDRPGTLADLGEALGRAGVNIMGGCGVSCDGQGEIHLLVEDAAAARRALEEAGISVQEETQVMVQQVEDRPGELGRLARMLADAGINIELLYLTTAGEVVLAVDNLEAARCAL